MKMIYHQVNSPLACIPNTHITSLWWMCSVVGAFSPNVCCFSSSFSFQALKIALLLAVIAEPVQSWVLSVLIKTQETCSWCWKLFFLLRLYSQIVKPNVLISVKTLTHFSAILLLKYWNNPNLLKPWDEGASKDQGFNLQTLFIKKHFK